MVFASVIGEMVVCLMLKGGGFEGSVREMILCIAINGYHSMVVHGVSLVVMDGCRL